MSRKLNKQWNELLCRLMGHNWVEGYKFKGAKGEVCSKVCCRCGFYENIIFFIILAELIKINQK